MSTPVEKRIVSVVDGLHKAAEARIRKSGERRFDAVQWRTVQVTSASVIYRLTRLFGVIDGNPYAVAIVRRAGGKIRVTWDSYIRELRILDESAAAA